MFLPCTYALPAHQAHIWVTTVSGSTLLPVAAGLLSAQERVRLDNLRFEQDRRTYLAAHALLRYGLSA